MNKNGVMYEVDVASKITAKLQISNRREIGVRLKVYVYDSKNLPEVAP